MMPTGMIVGSFVAGWWNDRFGRKGGMYLYTVFYIAVSIEYGLHFSGC